MPLSKRVSKPVLIAAFAAACWLQVPVSAARRSEAGRACADPQHRRHAPVRPRALRQGAPEAALAGLKTRSIAYGKAMAPKPSDSFPGMIALVTGGLPKQTGVFYDDVWTARSRRRLRLQQERRGGAVRRGNRRRRWQARHQDRRGQAAARSGRGCGPFYPHRMMRLNTIFDVAKAAGGRTAWGDKHPAYEVLQGRRARRSTTSTHPRSRPASRTSRSRRRSPMTSCASPRC